MQYDMITLPPKFAAVQDNDEQIHWAGKPVFMPFLLSGIPLLLFGLAWGAFDYFLFIRNMRRADAGFAIPFFAFHLFPFYAGILNMLRLVLVHGNTFYAASSRRLLIRSGFLGTDFESLDYRKITDLQVNVNPIDSMLGVGTIKAFSGDETSRRTRVYRSFVAVKSPYDVFKKIKELSARAETK